MLVFPTFQYLEPQFDPDVQAMFNVREEGGDFVDVAYKRAISNCVKEMKSIPGFWDDIFQLVILAGATTSPAVEVSIKGPNLRPVAILGSDIDPRTGAKGNNAVKYFQTGYTGAISGTAQNNLHSYCYITEAPTIATRSLFGRGGLMTGAWVCNHAGATRGHNAAVDSGGGGGVGGFGLDRSASGSYRRMAANTVTTVTRNSDGASTQPMFLMCRSSNGGAPENFCDARILMWALGPSHDLNDYTSAATTLESDLLAIP